MCCQLFSPCMDKACTSVYCVHLNLHLALKRVIGVIQRTLMPLHKMSWVFTSQRRVNCGNSQIMRQSPALSEKCLHHDCDSLVIGSNGSYLDILRRYYGWNKVRLLPLFSNVTFIEWGFRVFGFIKVIHIYFLTLFRCSVVDFKFDDPFFRQ